MIACLAIPGFPLRAALRSRPSLAAAPAALAPPGGEEPLLGPVTAAAEAQGVRPGMRMGEALATCPKLVLVDPDDGERHRELFIAEPAGPPGSIVGLEDEPEHSGWCHGDESRSPQQSARGSHLVGEQQLLIEDPSLVEPALVYASCFGLIFVVGAEGLNVAAGNAYKFLLAWSGGSGDQAAGGGDPHLHVQIGHCCSRADEVHSSHGHPADVDVSELLVVLILLREPDHELLAAVESLNSVP
jgi:hypothetical protein